MKIKLSILGVVLGIILLNACDDDMGLVGPSIQPEGDIPSVYTDTFAITASTVLIDSIYAKTATGLLGEIYDPLYGNLKSDYICQFYVQDGFKFAHEPIDGKIDSIDFTIYYTATTGWLGDSLAAMEATIYPVVKALDRNYYTNIRPEDYADLRNPLGAQAYTARNMLLSDSLYAADGPQLVIRMPQEVGQRIYDETVNNPASFATQDAFNRFFPGLYITNTFGSGNILYVDASYMSIHYSYYVKSVSTGALDSAVYANEWFPVTKEVVQMNRIQNANIEQLLQPNDKYTYLKTPSGVYTKITIPTKDIISKINGREVNNFYMSFAPMPQPEWKYAFSRPTYLAMIPEDSVKTFFEEGKITNSISSYLLSYNADSAKYIAGNVSNLLKYQMEYAPEDDLNMLLIPVTCTFQTDYYGNATSTPAAISNFLRPSGVTLRKDSEVMRVQVISSEYKK
ncbi:hypothetical protein M2459_002077 [Parabacteroides sp. PF5-5]|uniref:DUF4270 domain-containing protein n=1 Tax=unclassified Parabacteroides TaxID=2649774 RepID=UPI002476320D|nr:MULTISPECIES: DUF4270 domain-containing protein [unclassified Parabacteroides]MDH6305610.1 hypothetical protein [Parabacteroides sp. PH5-39]MDH6316352.1 hypothetical protein [Parabacteroides sp. PF5-13]MDH6319835.1 hypothetical protein [Parabacteroides sp. PH5-13]MDH6323574.1 hypothetical protein [Parabacteroides sp. PH5-8]MDH6327539.1 hypothetical protein [Parabacteroides sp. PH5-41]